MRKLYTLFFCCMTIKVFALDPNHFTITRISAPYFIVDANVPSTITTAYVGFEVKNNSNSATTYSNLKFTVSSIGTSVAGQNYTILAPATGITNVGTLAPGQSKVCYFYVSYPASVTPQATFNITLSDNTANNKIQSIVIRNRSSISANAGGTATQTFTNQDIIGGVILDDVTYVVGNVQNGDENDFQVAVSSQFDPTKIALLGTEVIASSIPGIAPGSTDSLYFISGNGTNGATVTIRWRFRITGFNFTNYLLPCAGATSGATNYKYALNTSLGSGTPVTVSASANPLTITKASDKSLYGINSPAIFTITITNPGAFGVTIDKITDQLPAGFTYQGLYTGSQVSVANSTTVPATGASGTINFEGGVLSGGNTSYYIPAGGAFVIKYTATSGSTTASNLTTTVRDYVAATQVGSAQHTVSVSATLPVSLVSFTGRVTYSNTQLNWVTADEINSLSFEIERSNSGDRFIKIGEVAASGISAGVTTYSFMDTTMPAGLSKYRLKMIDRDGQFRYSTVIALHKKEADFVIENIFPNPFINSTSLQLNSGKKQHITLQLVDVNGLIVFQNRKLVEKGKSILAFESLETLPAGSYLLEILTDSGRYTRRLIKAER